MLGQVDLDDIAKCVRIWGEDHDNEMCTHWNGTSSDSIYSGMSLFSDGAPGTSV